MKSVLFVDDHEVLARLSCEILEQHGYRAVPAYSAGEALEKFAAEPFDVVVTDDCLDIMKGWELAERLHRRRPAVPAIMAAGYFPSDATYPHIDAYVSKEALFPALFETISDLIRKAESGQLTRTAPTTHKGKRPVWPFR